LATLYDNFEWSYLQKNDFNLLTFNDLDPKSFLNLIDWFLDYVQPLLKISQRFWSVLFE